MAKLQATLTVGKGFDGPPGPPGPPGPLGPINKSIWRPRVDADGKIRWRLDTSETPPNPQNIKGEKGDKGDPGHFFAFKIVDDDLIMYYDDGTATPDVKINDEGYLIYNIKE